MKSKWKGNREEVINEEKVLKGTANVGEVAVSNIDKGEV